MRYGPCRPPWSPSGGRGPRPRAPIHSSPFSVLPSAVFSSGRAALCPPSSSRAALNPADLASGSLGALAEGREPAHTWVLRPSIRLTVGLEQAPEESAEPRGAALCGRGGRARQAQGAVDVGAPSGLHLCSCARDRGEGGAPASAGGGAQGAPGPGFRLLRAGATGCPLLGEMLLCSSREGTGPCIPWGLYQGHLVVEGLSPGRVSGKHGKMF